MILYRTCPIAVVLISLQAMFDEAVRDLSPGCPCTWSFNDADIYQGQRCDGGGGCKSLKKKRRRKRSRKEGENEGENKGGRKGGKEGRRKGRREGGRKGRREGKREGGRGGRKGENKKEIFPCSFQRARSIKLERPVRDDKEFVLVSYVP
jgi:hypothetical protein